MTNKNKSFDHIYHNIVLWLKDVKQHELTDIIELVEKAKSVFIAAEALPEEKIKQFVDNFKYDLSEFYQQYQLQVQHSIYLGLLNEQFWSALAQLTDKSQVEWAELGDDFQHNGLYQSGDYIGFGELECQQCQQTLVISHLTKISDCIHCGAHEFVRKALTP